MSHTLTSRAPDRGRSDVSGAGTAHPAVVLSIILATYLMIILDATIIITALPRIHEALGFSADRSVVGAERLHAHLRRVPPARRPGRRPPRASPHVPGRDRPVHRGLAVRRPRPVVGLAPGGPGPPGHRGGDRRPLDAGPAPDQLSRGPRAVAGRSAPTARWPEEGAAWGSSLGGMLTSWVSWRWALFINVPIGMVLDRPRPPLPPRVRAPQRPLRPGRRGHLDAGHDRPRLRLRPGGLGRLGGSGQHRLVRRRRGPARRLRAAPSAGRSSRSPRLHLFASRERAGSYVVRMLVVSGMFAMFFFLTQYFQGVLGYSALQAGLAFLPVTAVMFVAARTGPAHRTPHREHAVAGRRRGRGPGRHGAPRSDHTVVPLSRDHRPPHAAPRHRHRHGTHPA